MSESLETGQQDGPSVSLEEIQEMLKQSRSNEERYQRERDEERSRRQRVEQERDSATGQAQTEAERAFTANVQSAQSELAAAQADAERAEDAYAAAMEAGDFKAASKANRAIAAAENRIAQQTARKEWLESNKERFTAPPKQTAPPPPADDYQKYVPDILPAERVWLRDRPNFLTDSRYRKQVFRASEDAVEEGLARGSDAYLRRMTELLGEDKRQETEDKPLPRGERAPSSDLAPPRRTAPGQEPSGSRDFRLNEAQREAADALFGNPHNKDSFIADEAQRYRHYHDMNQRAMARR